MQTVVLDLSIDGEEVLVAASDEDRAKYLAVFATLLRALDSQFDTKQIKMSAQSDALVVEYQWEEWWRGCHVKTHDHKNVIPWGSVLGLPGHPSLSEFVRADDARQKEDERRRKEKLMHAEVRALERAERAVLARLQQKYGDAS